MKVLVVDDDSFHREHVCHLICAEGYEALGASDGLDALDKLETFEAEVILTDLRMPRMDGFELLKHLRSENALPPTIVLSAFGGVEVALSVVHEMGGFWFLEKPIDPRSLRVLLDRAYSHGMLERDNRELRRQLSFQGAIGDLTGKSEPMKRIFALIRQAAPTSAPILITGESGTGKELAARAIHSFSKRAQRPFVAVNCAAVPESLIESEIFGHEKGSFTGAVERRAGCLELAEGGTLFLDELGEMPVLMQAKLLRVLEDFHFRRLGGKVELKADVRVIAATNRDPLDAIKEGKLREDLYYRLNVFPMELPPLRDRLEDLPLLVDTLIGRANERHGTRVTGVDNEVLRLFAQRTWEGNVRELRNVIERAVILAGSGVLGVDSFTSFKPQPAMGSPKETPAPQEPVAAPAPSPLLDPSAIAVGVSLDSAERALIEATLAQARNNKTKAAAILGITTKTLHAKLKRYQLSSAAEGGE